MRDPVLLSVGWSAGALTIIYTDSLWAGLTCALITGIVTGIAIFIYDRY